MRMAVCMKGSGAAVLAQTEENCPCAQRVTLDLCDRKRLVLEHRAADSSMDSACM
jgi:hypothetical protein